MRFPSELSVSLVSSPTVRCTLPQNCQRNDLGLLSLYMNAFLFFLWAQDDLAGSTTIIVYACMRILKSQWLYTVMVYKPETEKATEW